MCNYQIISGTSERRPEGSSAVHASRRAEEGGDHDWEGCTSGRESRVRALKQLWEFGPLGDAYTHDLCAMNTSEKIRHTERGVGGHIYAGYCAA